MFGIAGAGRRTTLIPSDVARSPFIDGGAAFTTGVLVAATSAIFKVASESGTVQLSV
jgi:hypothetical protein